MSIAAARFTAKICFRRCDRGSTVTAAGRYRRWHAAIAAGILSAHAAVGHSDDSTHWPTQNVRIVVGYPAGSAPDSLARLVADPLSDALGRPVVVENRSGAAGTIGVAAVVKSTDDHTLGFATSSALTTAKLLFKTLPYDPVRDVRLISLSASSPLVLVCDAELPPTSLNAFVSWAKTQARGVTYGSAGVGTGSHLTMELFATQTRFAAVHVPYPAIAQVTTAIISHQVQAAFVPPSGAFALAAAGKLRVLAVSSAQRWARMPELPTVAEESGIKDFRSEIWIAVVGPTAMPADAAARLALEINTILRRPEIREKLGQQGWEIVAGGPEELRQRIADDLALWGPVIRDAKVPRQ
jgi:tripartite-type tricarboxylate transporter receptor subunit TctC